MIKKDNDKKMSVMQKKRNYLYILLVLVVLAWGLSWPANKEGLNYAPPLWFASMRLGFATITMFILTFFLKKLIWPSWKDVPIIFVIGIFQIAFFILFINLGLEFGTSGRSAILVYTTPLWVMPPAILIFKEHSSPVKWLGFVLGIIGVLIMVGPWEMDWSNSSIRIGTIFLLLASISFSVSILCARHMTWHHTPFELIPWQLLIASLLVITIAYIYSPHPHIHWNVTAVTCVFYTAIIATALGFWGISVLSKGLTSIIMSLSFLGVPVSGVIFSVILLHEALPLFMIIAMLFIVLGLSCVALGERNKGNK